MVQFNIDVNSILRLKDISNLSNKFEKTSEGVLLTFEDNKITPHIYGNKSFLEYSIDVQNFQNTQQQSTANYIKVDFLKFTQAVEKCNINDEGISVAIDVDKNIVSVSPTNSSTPKIAINCYDTVDQKQAEVIIDTWNLNKNSDEFLSGTTQIAFNDEILKFAEETSGIMSISSTTNAISITGNKLHYADRFCVIEKTLPNELVASDKEIIITKNLFDFLKTLHKSSGVDIQATFSNSKNFIRIDCAEVGIRAVLWIGDVQYAYPNQEEYSYIVPTEERKKALTIDKKALIDALSKFDGIFSPTEYRWKQVNFINKDEPKLYFEHQDYTAEVNTSADITVVSDNLPVKDFSFNVSGLILKKIVDLMKDDTIIFEYSDESSTEPHGFGIVVKNDSITAVCTKLNTDM